MKPFNKTYYAQAVVEDYMLTLLKKLEAEGWKANAERNAKKEAERPPSPTMDIYSEVGTRIVYTGTNGYDGDREQANRCLSIGGTYTVKKIDVEAWSSSVELLEVPGKYFNTVMFRESDK